MLAPGAQPDLDFKLDVVRDGVVENVRFRDLFKRPTIVSVYMKNKTPSCDRQNDSLVAQAATLAKAGYDLVALSRDTCGSHQKYAVAKKITYVLASDPEDRFAQAMEAVVEKSMYGKKYFGPARAAFVFDRNGKVLAVIEKVDTADHAGQLLAVLKTL